MLGHVLRMAENNPANCSLSFAIHACQQLKGRRGRHRMNLLSIVKSDLRKRNLKLTSASDLWDLRSVASNRKKWSELY